MLFVSIVRCFLLLEVKGVSRQFGMNGETSYHKSNMLKSEALANVEKGRQLIVEQHQNYALQKQILENRKLVLLIIETVMFSTRQGIAL